LLPHFAGPAGRDTRPASPPWWRAVASDYIAYEHCNADCGQQTADLVGVNGGVVAIPPAAIPGIYPSIEGVAWSPDRRFCMFVSNGSVHLLDSTQVNPDGT